MREADDDMLLAYADGQLDPVNAARIARHLAVNPAAREKVRRFEESAALARAAYAHVLDEPVPAALIAAIGADTALRPPSRWRRRQAPVWTLPLAASVALAIGWWYGGTDASPTDLLSATLEHAASGQQRDDGVMSITASTAYPAGGRWCREFIRHRGGALAAGFACREPTGLWSVEALVPAGDPQAYVPAAEEPSPVLELIEAARTGPALPADRESALIARGWSGDLN
ncbi:MAG TPA: hypothetical protein PKA13_01220 [Geminicoccaceae bacterium]|nr:hypothetical protein [Geminicoccus sp.]HMU48360.1 hypothetical protein [Geminicoccaceae bacterium]